MSKEVILNENNFEKEVIKADKPVLIDFWAAWCGPCKMVAPTVAEIAEEYSDKIKICKCDVDENNDLAMKYGISSIPTLLVFNNGEEVKRSTGALPKERIVNLFIDLI